VDGYIVRAVIKSVGIHARNDYCSQTHINVGLGSFAAGRKHAAQLTASLAKAVKFTIVYLTPSIRSGLSYHN
jgi:hypothetical protein